MTDDEPQLLKDLRQMVMDIKTIAACIAKLIEYSLPVDDDAHKTLCIAQQMMKNIIDR